MVGPQWRHCSQRAVATHVVKRVVHWNYNGSRQRDIVFYFSYLFTKITLKLLSPLWFAQPLCTARTHALSVDFSSCLHIPHKHDIMNRTWHGSRCTAKPVYICHIQATDRTRSATLGGGRFGVLCPCYTGTDGRHVIPLAALALTRSCDPPPPRGRPASRLKRDLHRQPRSMPGSSSSSSWDLLADHRPASGPCNLGKMLALEILVLVTIMTIW